MGRMTSHSSGRRSRTSLRVRVLAIALIPSIVLVVAGAGVNAYLLMNALKKRDTATLLSNGYNMAVPFMPAMSEERRASIAMAADPSPQNRQALAQARQGMDQLMSRFSSISTQVANAMPPTAKASIGRFTATMPQIFAVRKQIDMGQASRLRVYEAFNQVADAMINAANAIGRDSSDRDVALRRSQASDLMRMSDWLDRSNALAAAAYSSGGLTQAEADQYNSLTRAYRADLSALEPQLPTEEQGKVDQLRSSQGWDDLGRVEDAIVHQSFGPRATKIDLPVSVQRWQDDAHTIATALSTMGLGDLGVSAAALEKRSADDALTRSAIIAAASLLIALLVLIVALRLGSRLVRRLRYLRADTLEADARLPRLVERIRRGERVDPDAEIPNLDYGSDEVGEVAAAFNKAQQTAILAAVQEAHLREGTNVVFLNIARRSQALVQRQLQVLEKAQRATEDPDQVALLFQLDHLSTRDRRNAENLIILGGGRLARQWKTAVRLIDLIRAAVAETEQYNRVSFRRVPDMLIAGDAVADIVHLIAELVDNAIDFSPRDSRIEVSSNQIGHGVVVEIDDQGIGIPAERREEYNAMFRDPPDFGVMALRDDTRIGFFVVARLARRHGIRVSLVESAYGGIRAAVLIPTNLITFIEGETTDRPADDVSWFDKPEPAAAEPPTNGADVLTGTTVHRGALGQAARIPTQGARGETATDEGPRHREGDGSRHDAADAARWPQPDGGGNGRPTLPRRRRQAHLAPQLREEPAAAEPEPIPRDEDGAALARRRMAAFQRGTAMGRADRGPWDRTAADTATGDRD